MMINIAHWIRRRRYAVVALGAAAAPCCFPCCCPWSCCPWSCLCPCCCYPAALLLSLLCLQLSLLLLLLLLLLSVIFARALKWTKRRQFLHPQPASIRVGGRSHKAAAAATGTAGATSEERFACLTDVSSTGWSTRRLICHLSCSSV